MNALIKANIMRIVAPASSVRIACLHHSVVALLCILGVLPLGMQPNREGLEPSRTQ
jgi:hypothetical protein